MADDRYRALFEQLAPRAAIAFVPFVMLGDPDPETCLEIVDALIAGGADALEIGVPFSDPVADGPTIQSASLRARAAGVTPPVALEVAAEIRRRHGSLPMGLLVYGNLAARADFYPQAATAGIDSVLVADVPAREAAPFIERARQAALASVLIAPPNASDTSLARIAALSEGYTYVVTRRGVTGTETEAGDDLSHLLATLKELGAAPPVLGFGISKPEHLAAARRSGAAGAISGSAIVRLIGSKRGAERLEALRAFTRTMKAATLA